jgi:hypothetical protein
MYANERIGPLAARAAKTRKGGWQAGADAAFSGWLASRFEGVRSADAGTHQLLHTL